MFDPEAFKNAAIHDVISDKYVPMPVGDYYGLCSKVECKAGESARGPWAYLEMTFDFDQRKNKRLSFWLRFDDEGHLDKNRNLILGQLRKAIGKDTGAFNWTDAEGHSMMVGIGHEADKEDAEKLYERITGFRKG